MRPEPMIAIFIRASILHRDLRFAGCEDVAKKYTQKRVTLEAMTAAEYPNQYWHIAYHAVFYTHLYLQPAEADFRPWAKHKQECQYLGPRPWAPQETRKVETSYTKAEVLEYHEICCAEVEARVPALDIEAPSGNWPIGCGHE